jgi:hypothetical protein
MQPTANASKEEDDHDLAVPYTLYQTPKREQWRSQDIPSVLKSDQCNRSFLIRMVAATALLATFVVMTGPLQQKALIVQLTSSQPRYNETSGWWNESFLNESLPREPSSPKESSNDAPSSNKVTIPVDYNNQLSEVAWKGFLKRFRMAMQTQSYEVWLPVVVRGSKVYVAQQHLTRVQKERGRRFKLFTAMMSHALNVTSSILQSSNVDKVRRKKVLPLLDETWRDRPIPLLMALGDQRRCEGKKFPRFGWSRLEDKECTMFALPSFNVYRDAPEDSPDYDLFHKNLEQLYPWSKKKPQAVWRGSATGRISNDWTDLPRAQLVNVSIYHPSLLDAGFVHAKQFKNMYPKQEAQLHQNSRFAKWIDFKDFQKYRAVVDIDGNSWSDRFGNLLCLNSAVVKVSRLGDNLTLEFDLHNV